MSTGCAFIDICKKSNVVYHKNTNISFAFFENLNCQQIYTYIFFFAFVYHTGSKKAHKITLDRVEDHKGKKETCNWNVASWFLNPFSFLGYRKNRIFPS